MTSGETIPSGAERRRSQRIPWSVVIDIVSLNPLLKFHDRCATIDVSNHGCQFFSPFPFKRGTWLRLTTTDNRRNTTAHAVRSLLAQPSVPRFWKVGVELDNPDNFCEVETLSP